jgi:hypothetical protein
MCSSLHENDCRRLNVRKFRSFIDSSETDWLVKHFCEQSRRSFTELRLAPLDFRTLSSADAEDLTTHMSI